MVGFVELFSLLIFGAAALPLFDSDDDDSVSENDSVDLTRDFATGPEGSGDETDGDDTIIGSADDETLRGLLGDDILDAGAGDDVVNGGGGADTIFGAAGDDTLRGFDGDDSITGEAGDDSLRGNDGNDLLIGGFGADTLLGGIGDDSLHGTYDAVPDGLFGATDLDEGDTLSGGDGSDSLFLGSGDSGTGGNDADRFVAGTWVDPGNPAIIQDFDATEDELIILFDPTEDDSTPDVTTTVAGDDMIVSVDGNAVMRVANGAATVTPEFICLIETTLAT